MLDAALRRVPDHPTLLADLAAFARQAGERERQAQALARLVDLGADPPQRANWLRELAALYVSLEEEPLALARFTELHELDPDDLEALVALERMAERSGDHETLVRLLDRRATLATRSDDVRRLRLRRATTLEQRLGRSDEAKAELEALLATTGDHLVVLRELADLDERLSEHLTAAPLWLRASALAHDRAEAAELAQRSHQAYLRGGDVEAATRVLEGMGGERPAPASSPAALAELRSAPSVEVTGSSLLELTPEELAAVEELEASEVTLRSGVGLGDSSRPSCFPKGGNGARLVSLRDTRHTYTQRRIASRATTSAFLDTDPPACRSQLRFRAAPTIAAPARPSDPAQADGTFIATRTGSALHLALADARWSGIRLLQRIEASPIRTPIEWRSTATWPCFRLALPLCSSIWQEPRATIATWSTRPPSRTCSSRFDRSMARSSRPRSRSSRWRRSRCELCSSAKPCIRP